MGAVLEREGGREGRREGGKADRWKENSAWEGKEERERERVERYRWRDDEGNR